VLGEELAILLQVETIEREVHNDHVRCVGTLSRDLGEARVAEFALARTRALVAADADLGPCRVGDAERHVGNLTRVGLVAPCDELLHFSGNALRGITDVELVGSGFDVIDALATQVVVAPLQHRPFEGEIGVVGERALQDRQVDARQLVLQRLGVGGDHRILAGRQDGHEITERLAGAGARLNDERRAARDGVGDVRHHVGLSVALLGSVEHGEHPLEQVGRAARGRRHAREATSNASASSSWRAPKSGHATSVKYTRACAACQSMKLEMRVSPEVRTNTSTGGSEGS